MIAEAGLAALWIAAALALLQFVLAVGAVRSPVIGEAPTGVRPVAVVQGLFVGIAFLLLMTCFMQSDMSVKLVAANSHSMKPMLYKWAGTWGNHEGSMLLWVAVLGFAGALVAIFERRLDEKTLLATLGSQALIAFGFYAFLLFVSNPFARLNPAPIEGNGLNPLLQDPGLAFHPPTLYLGYVGMSVAFSFAVGALITRNVDRAFAQAMRPWVLGAWVFLTLGITAGSYWAYYELGWGGWWFWDPVENASLMPWLAATALLHSVTVLATRDGLRAWTVMLAVVAFSMSMVGTFLVRSGILTSVHSFAVDPARGSFILVLLALYIGGALALFGLRIATVKEGSQFDLVSREGALVANNLLLSAILGVVLIGTLYPLAAEALGSKISVGPPYFDATAGPLALALVVIMALGPLSRWRRDELKAVIGRVSVPVAITVIAFIAMLIFAPSIGVLPFVGIVLALGVGAASLAPLWKRNLRRTPMFTYGMVIAHLGIAVSLLGMATERSFIRETLVAVRVGETAKVGPYTIKFADVTPVAGPNWTALEATLEATRTEGWLAGGKSFTLHPQARMFSSPVTETSEAAIATRIDGQLYLVLGKADDSGRWQLRLWWKPLVTLIWLGGFMVALGGALSLIGRMRRDRVAAQRLAWS
jgi:cytochrome c-type biogenesis protein CcmF